MDEVDSDLGAFDNDVNPEDSKSSRVTSRPQRRTAPATPNTSVMGITNEQTRVVKLCQVHSNELDEAYRSNRYVVKDTIL